ncbi:MAG: hypothetical protein A2Y23_07520 [Clostridiales bacterium GWB2_37_7]|nr:MAG: hypothetical protein A2Y23_07520 [Clostridiales bacterium GWB2_37_7]
MCLQLFNNSFFELTSAGDKLYIQVLKPGFDIREFNNIMADFPIIHLTNFICLRKALVEATGALVHIGSLKNKIEVMLSKDEMQATIFINLTQKELELNKAAIATEIIRALNAYGITEGIENVYEKPLLAQCEFVIAKGIPPIYGVDAKLAYYELSDKKPLVKEDGSVNYYELNLIDNVRAGDWLGERIPPQEGKPGMTVTGKLVPGKKGKDSNLRYDKKTIREVSEGNKVILRALVDGAVKFDGSKIKIDNHLIVPADVGYETGNISFDGFVTINGTVKDGFSVTAKYDISINGKIGIGAVGKIHSREGSIYIRGGIYGKNTAKIEANKNVYVKYCNECSITSGEDINIGFYALDSKLNAQKVLLDPKYGKIIGGSVIAEVKVVSGVIGNKYEKKTVINVQGFDRNQMRKEFEKLLEKYKVLLQDAGAVKRQIEVFEYNLSGAEYANMDEYNKYVMRYEDIVDEIKMLDEARKKLQQTLQTKGEGEVGIFQAAYPETFLEIKNMQRKINSIVNGSFYAENRELHHN